MKLKFLIFALIGLLSFSGCPPTEAGSKPTRQERPKIFKTLSYTDKVYEAQVKTLQCYRLGDPFSYPVLYLGEERQLRLEFDLLQAADAQPENLIVDVLPCDHDWQPNNLLPLEFIEGFSSDRIYDWERSQNTLIPYFHYRYDFPAAGNSFKRSGNYLLRVYRSGNERDLLLTKRIVVADNRLPLESNVGFARMASQRQRLQRVDFKIGLQGLDFPGIFDPRNDLKVYVMQNFRWDNAASGLQPMFSTDTELDYQLDAGNQFEGGNEFRMIDLRSIRFRSRNVKQIENRDSLVYFDLYPDEPRTRNLYFSKPDLNGNFAVEVQEYPRANIESDYVFVRFSLKYAEPIKDGKVFVIGKFNDWACDSTNQLDYNPAAYRYEGELMLKQGLYDYGFALQQKNRLNEAIFEGSHAETENYYTILVYYHPFGARASELVALRHINFYDR